jgi:hypothetical protein
MADALETTRLPRVPGLSSGRTALLTTRPFHGGLCDPMAMSTGHSRDGEVVREERSDNCQYIDGEQAIDPP